MNNQNMTKLETKTNDKMIIISMDVKRVGHTKTNYNFKDIRVIGVKKKIGLEEVLI